MRRDASALRSAGLQACQISATACLLLTLGPFFGAERADRGDTAVQARGSAEAQRSFRRGLTALERAERLGGAMGPYALQAAIAACHARAATAAETDWPRIVALYDAVAQLAPSPVVELNRAVAVGMAFGPAAGLDLVDGLVREPALEAYHLLPAVRGDLLRKLGRYVEARAEFERAASLTENVVERKLLQRRAAECGAEEMAG